MNSNFSPNLKNCLWKAWIGNHNSIPRPLGSHRAKRPSVRLRHPQDQQALQVLELSLVEDHCNIV